MSTIKALITPTPEPANNTPQWACRDRHERLFPDAEWEDGMMVSSAKNIKHPFLQAIVDCKAIVTIIQGEWTVLGAKSLILLHVYKNFINIECISTPEEFRGKGSASKCMRMLVAVSNKTNIPLRLRASNVTGHGWNGLPQHVVIAAGMRKKGKIPVRDLPKWYEKFGFELVANVYHKGKPNGYNMQYIPKPKTVQP